MLAVPVALWRPLPPAPSCGDGGTDELTLSGSLSLASNSGRFPKSLHTPRQSMVYGFNPYPMENVQALTTTTAIDRQSRALDLLCDHFM